MYKTKHLLARMYTSRPVHCNRDHRVSVGKSTREYQSGDLSARRAFRSLNV